MKSLLIALIVATGSVPLCAQQTPKDRQEQGTTPAAASIKTERIDATVFSNVKEPTSEAGYMDSAQVKALLHKIWLAEFRINDLLSQANPGRWKIGDSERRSFGQTMDGLHRALATAEDWRTQFGERTDSLYLGFETYVAFSAVLPRLQGVTQSVSLYENASFGAQCSQAGLHLFDLLQALQPYLEYLMRNQDRLIYATQTNLATCQKELGYAMSGHSGPAKPMKNIAPKFKGRPRSRRKVARAGSTEEKKGQGAAAKGAEELAGVKPTAKSRSKLPDSKAKPEEKEN